MTTRSSRALGTVLCLLFLSVPALGEAQTRSPRREPVRTQPATGGGTRLAGLIGFEAEGDTALALRGDAEFDIQPLTTGWLSGVFSVGYSGFDNVDLFKFGPALRYTLKVSPEIGLYFDGGVGLYWASIDTGRFGGDDDEVGLMLRLGPGAFLEVSPSVRLGAEFSVMPYFGDFDETTVALLFGASFGL